MTRLFFFLALAVFGLMAARRWTSGVGNKRPRAPRPVPRNDNEVASVICATCRTEYRPNETAWQCPKCQR
jgi:hypothetical protein